MKTYAKIVLGVFLLGAIIAGWYLPFSTVTQLVTGSAVGTTFVTAKVAQINFSPATGTATSTSVYNSDDSDRIVTDAFVSCNTLGTSYTAYTGTGLASLQFFAATTSASAPAIVTNPNFAMNVVVATSTPTDAFTATSTYTFVPGRRWKTATYMTFFSNATNTAACTVGVHYVGS